MPEQTGAMYCFIDAVLIATRPAWTPAPDPRQHLSAGEVLTTALVAARFFGGTLPAGRPHPPGPRGAAAPPRARGSPGPWGRRALWAAPPRRAAATARATGASGHCTKAVFRANCTN